jgi:AcrR family transcriptional regulator
MTELRADARRNRELILSAARDVFVERGPNAPLDEVAARAGVGIGTLYRRFPDRAALLHAVVLDVLQRVADEARAALDEEADAFSALTRYMHRALDLRVSAVVPALIGEVSIEDGALQAASQQSAEVIQTLIDQAQADGGLRAEVAFADITLLLVRLSRPLPSPMPRDLDLDLAHRHLDLVLDGLRARCEHVNTPLRGPALSRADLRALPLGNLGRAAGRPSTVQRADATL